MGLPNWITVARIALIPVFVALAYLGPAGLIAALVVFLIASLSDLLDGYLARRNDDVSSTGEFLDPLADKLLIGAALFVLVDARSFPLWAALLIAVREIAVQVLRTRIVRSGGALPASSAAKFKTVLQIVMVSWWLLPFEQPMLVHWLLLALALAATVVSALSYFRADRSAEVAR